MISNLWKLCRLNGGYANSIWGYLIFISMSAIFYFAGKFIPEKIIDVKGRIEFPESIDPLSRLKFISLRWLLGTWLMSMVWLVLGILNLFSKQVALLFFFAGMILFAVILLRLDLKLFFFDVKFEAKTFVWIIFGLWLLIFSTIAVLPQFYWDTLMNNLAIPGHYAAEGNGLPNPFNIYSYFSQNAEMLSVWPLFFCSQVNWGRGSRRW